MNNLMSNFSGLEMSRMEMKNVKGGQCYLRNGGGSSSTSKCNGLQNCKDLVADNWGSNYCCDSCGSASWCSGGRCPQE